MNRPGRGRVRVIGKKTAGIIVLILVRTFQNLDPLGDLRENPVGRSISTTKVFLKRDPWE